MHVEIVGFGKSKQSAIEKAAKGEWNFEEPDLMRLDGKLAMVLEGESNLCGGESDEEFAKRLTLAVWTANGKPCTVNVTAIFMEDLPREDYSFDENSKLAKGFKPAEVEEEE